MLLRLRIIQDDPYRQHDSHLQEVPRRLAEDGEAGRRNGITGKSAIGFGTMALIKLVVYTNQLYKYFGPRFFAFAHFNNIFIAFLIDGTQNFN